jgi:hypothetical protein
LQVQADRDQLLSSTTTLQDQLQATRKASHKADHELRAANNALQLAQVRTLSNVFVSWRLMPGV